MNNLITKKLNNGITLIVLVVLIVVMLIISGVALSLITGYNNIFSITKESSDKYTNSSKTEKDKIDTLLETMNQINTETSIVKKPIKITKAELNRMINAKIEAKTQNNPFSNTDSDFVFEQGTNYYAKKYDNGTMELYGAYSSTMTTTTEWGSGYYGSLVTITFPIEFTEKPYIIPVLSRTGSANVFSLSLNNVSKTTFNFYPYSLTAKVTNASYSVYYIAIGKWK